MKQEQIVKINEKAKITIETFNKRNYRIRPLNQDGSKIEGIEAKHMIKQNKIEEEVSEMVCEIIAKDFDGTLEVDEQVIIESFTYQTWVSVGFDGQKVLYDLSTIHAHAEDVEDFDKNQVSRKTWKGLVNYIDRFDK